MYVWICMRSYVCFLISNWFIVFLKRSSEKCFFMSTLVSLFISQYFLRRILSRSDLQLFSKCPIWCCLNGNRKRTMRRTGLLGVVVPRWNPFPVILLYRLSPLCSNYAGPLPAFLISSTDKGQTKSVTGDLEKYLSCFFFFSVMLLNCPIL